MGQVRYRGVLMAAETATVFQEKEAGQTLFTPLLYLLARAGRPQQLLLGSSLDDSTLAWLDLAVPPSKDNAVPMQGFDLALLGSWDDWPPPRGTLRVGGLLMLSLVETTSPPLLEDNRAWRSVVVEEQNGQLWLLASPLENAPRYVESPRESFMALLLGMMQPGTLALGPNVVFDGSMKPRATRVNFSGSGGQIGAGDLLIAHPEDIQRFTPLPGAVALLIGAAETALQTPHATLPFEDGALTLVVA